MFAYPGPSVKDILTFAAQPSPYPPARNAKSLDKTAFVCYLTYIVIVRRKKATTVGFIALGCPKNTVDSERMLAEIAEAGLAIASDPDRADVVVINTCGFIEPAKVESLDAIRHALQRKRQGHVQRVVVTGCLAERLGKGLLEEAEGVDAVVGLAGRDQISQIITNVIHSRDEAPYTSRYHQVTRTVRDGTRLLIGPQHRAYLRISEGCDRRCSFCTIPAIRGPFRSKSIRSVIDEARQLASAGVKELSLIGQDTTRYLSDRKVQAGLVQLLHRLERIEDLTWIRLMYLFPADVSDGLLDAVAVSHKVVHYLDIPVQHVNSRILRAMRRPNSSARLMHLIERIRRIIPDAVLRTTVIAGFPGETEAEFNELLQFIQWANFDALGCFRFYPEPGTPAAELPGQVADSVKEERVDRVMTVQQPIAFAKQEARIGTRLTCLVDEDTGKGTGRGRFYGQAPEVDSVCLIRDCTASPGQFIRARVIGTRDYDLVVRQTA
jgi:ribosomal protein S12 methylthiotransferase